MFGKDALASLEAIGREVGPEARTVSLIDSKFQTPHEVADFGSLIKLQHLKILHHFRRVFANTILLNLFQ
jgi:hypothetical protein